MAQADIVIVAAARTAVGNFGGTLAKTPAPELGAAVIQELLKRAQLSGEHIDEVILGQVPTAAALRGQQRNGVGDKGIASLCSGGGMAWPLTVER